ncbi:MAG: tRNA pseudouridine(55) synthase TruB [Clostridia bacterium]|nr:tRNA pseudouridine(55) synthase TruB [Clostridia bacterium]
MNGFLNILKPPGMTSAAVVAVVKRLTGEKRVGHAGTLDPEAAGVLPIMIGRAARLFDYLVDKEKAYVAECAFGAETDTQDATGVVTREGTNYPDFAAVCAAAKQLEGDILQRPGMYSAIKQGGVPMYERARRGESVEVPQRQVHVESITLHEERPNHGVLMTVRCGRGTYIRSICEDLGRLTGCPAHMRFLLRSKSGVFTLDTAITLEEAAAHKEAGTLADNLLPLDWPIQHICRVNAPEWLAKQVINGVKLPVKRVRGAAEVAEGQPVRVYLRGQFWGIAAREGDMLVWKCQTPPDHPADPNEKTAEEDSHEDLA